MESSERVKRRSLSRSPIRGRDRYSDRNRSRNRSRERQSRHHNRDEYRKPEDYDYSRDRDSKYRKSRQDEKHHGESRRGDEEYVREPRRSDEGHHNREPRLDEDNIRESRLDDDDYRRGMYRRDDSSKSKMPSRSRSPRSQEREPFQIRSQIKVINTKERIPERSESRKNKDDGKGTSPHVKDKKKSKKSKDKKKKKRETSSSSSSSSESDSGTSVDSLKLLEKLEEERKRQLAETKKRKEMLKAIETPEEKRARRLMKKDAKERRRKEARGWDKEYQHYTNVDNPFGDPSLLESFHWKKKLEKQGLNDITREDLERINRAKQEENKRELEKVKKRRQERELERQRREEEEALLQRQKEAAQFKEWGNQEDLFHLEQATLRSKIRIKDGRAKPIDLLAQYISAEQEVDAIEMHEPYTYLNGLTISDLEDLIEDIKVYKELEKGKNLSYWNDITVIVEDELRKLRKLEQDDDYRIALERREGINPSVAKDVAAVFKHKTAEQLQALKTQIQSKLDGSSSGVDISYWESLLSQLKAHIARAQLRDRHQDNLKKKLAMLKAEQGVEPGPDTINSISPRPGPSNADVVMRDEDVDETSQTSVASEKAATETSSQDEEDDDNIIDESITRYMNGGYSPKLIGQDDIEPGIFVIGEEEDNARLDLARSQVLHVGQKVENVWTAEEKALQHEAKKGMTDDEATFSVESPLDQLYLWSDKYRPRKPRYFNRVHTGFEWNKYNQTHYDMDNPPPKIVQGYKFNIFYPDLIDKNSTPQYYLTSCADNQDFAILRFHAGPPYEDIAFKIVNREWEYSYKRGFRCQFHNNIFQLWFHFKRYRYRR